MPEHVILFLAANPDGTDPLKLGEECAEIDRRARRGASARDDVGIDFEIY